MHKKDKYRRVFLLFALAFLSNDCVFAGGGASGGSTEFTQKMNNTELVANVKNTADTLKTVNSTLTETIKMVKDSATNLTSLPAEFSWIKDVANTASESYRLYSTLERAKRDFGDASGWLERRVKAYQCSPNQRLDSCLQKLSSNVEKYRLQKSDDTKYWESSINSSKRNLDKLQEMIARGRASGTGNKEQLNILQEQTAIIGANLNEMIKILAESKIKDEENSIARHRTLTQQGLDDYGRYKKSTDRLNYYRSLSGRPPIDTKNDPYYNVDTKAISEALYAD